MCVCVLCILSFLKLFVIFFCPLNKVSYINSPSERQVLWEAVRSSGKVFLHGDDRSKMVNKLCRSLTNSNVRRHSTASWSKPEELSSSLPGLTPDGKRFLLSLPPGVKIEQQRITPVQASSRM